MATSASIRGAGFPLFPFEPRLVLPSFTGLRTRLDRLFLSWDDILKQIATCERRSDASNYDIEALVGNNADRINQPVGGVVELAAGLCQLHHS